MTAIRMLGAVLLAFVFVACGTANADGPPEIIYGRDICVHCNMIITEIAHAAAYRLESGEERTFDGIGEMVRYGREHDEFSNAEAWVHDYWSEEWVVAETAFYVPTRSVSSPMGHGIFGFSNRERAAAFAAEVGGEVIDWAAVLALPVVDGLVGAHHHDDDSEDAMDHDETNDHEMEGGG